MKTNRDMYNFNFPEKVLGRVSPSHFVYDFSRKMFLNLLADQISLSDCLYLSRYWAICVLQLFVNQAVTSQNSRLTLSSDQVVLLHDQKVQTKI